MQPLRIQAGEIPENICQEELTAVTRGLTSATQEGKASMPQLTQQLGKFMGRMTKGQAGELSTIMYRDMQNQSLAQLYTGFQTQHAGKGTAPGKEEDAKPGKKTTKGATTVSGDAVAEKTLDVLGNINTVLNDVKNEIHASIRSRSG